MSQETRKVTAEAGLTKVLQNRFAGRTRPAVYLFCKSVVACFFLFPGQASNGREVQAEEQKAKFADRDTEESDPMKIVRIYNNSCASVTDEAGQDMVAIGRGITFGKKAGDELDGAQVEKLYLLEDTDVSGRLASVLDGIEDADIYLEISEEIFAFLRAEGCQVRESLLLTLTDHIATSVEREHQGVILENPLLADIRQLYHHQYQLAKQAAEIIKKHTGVTVSKDEIGFITLHIVSASSDGGFDNLLEITHIIQKILAITEEQFGIQLNENSLRYERFIRHLQFFARRILDPASVQETNLLMYNMGRREFPDAFLCVKAIAQMVEKDYGRHVSNAEQGYLIYHIMNVVLEMQENNSEKEN